MISVYSSVDTHHNVPQAQVQILEFGALIFTQSTLSRKLRARLWSQMVKLSTFIPILTTMTCTSQPHARISICGSDSESRLDVCNMVILSFHSTTLWSCLPWCLATRRTNNNQADLICYAECNEEEQSQIYLQESSSCINVQKLRSKAGLRV
jgi:hypothetical protein